MPSPEKIEFKVDFNSLTHTYRGFTMGDTSVIRVLDGIPADQLVAITDKFSNEYGVRILGVSLSNSCFWPNSQGIDQTMIIAHEPKHVPSWQRSDFSPG